jgi:hypothetical protein
MHILTFSGHLEFLLSFRIFFLILVWCTKKKIRQLCATPKLNCFRTGSQRSVRKNWSWCLALSSSAAWPKLGSSVIKTFFTPSTNEPA